MNLKEQLKNNPPRANDLVDIPLWGDGVKVKVFALNGLQRADFVKRFVKHGPDGKPNGEIPYGADVYQQLLLGNVHDPVSGGVLFGADDGDLLLGQDAQVLEDLSKVVLRLSGLASEEGKDPAEKAAGNSSETPTAA